MGSLGDLLQGLDSRLPAAPRKAAPQPQQPPNVAANSQRQDQGAPANAGQRGDDGRRRRV